MPSIGATILREAQVERRGLNGRSRVFDLALSCRNTCLGCSDLRVA